MFKKNHISERIVGVEQTIIEEKYWESNKREMVAKNTTALQKEYTHL